MPHLRHMRVALALGVLVAGLVAWGDAGAGAGILGGQDRSRALVVGEPDGEGWQPVSEALTGWEKFGNAKAIGQGWYGGPEISLVSTTRSFPARVRLVVAGSQARLDHVEWTITCFNAQGSETDSRQGSRDDVRLPFRHDYSITGWMFCELDVKAWQEWDGSRSQGNLIVKLQARYQD